MLKTIRIATLLTAVSAFAMPAMAQTSDTIVPGSEAQIDNNEAASRNDVAAESDINLAQPENPVANATAETIVPGNEAEIDTNEAAQREAVAEGTMAETTGPMGAKGDDQLIPGSGATFSPNEAPEGQNAVVQDQADTDAVK